MTTIGQLTLPDSHAAALTPMAERISAVLGDRIDPVTVSVRPRLSMPEYAPGKTARGYWREAKRTIRLSDDLFDDPDASLLDKTFGHEAIHTLFSDWITKWHKRQLLPLIAPQPENFGDLTLAGKQIGYPASPEECCCVWGSAALFGFDPPAYVGIYRRTIAKANLPALRDILLADPKPVQPDPCQALREDLAAAQASLIAEMNRVSAMKRLAQEALEV